MADLKPLFKMATLAGVQVAVRLHIRRGDDVNAIDEKGRTPLMLAASSGYLDICRLLLDAGANPLALDVERSDALTMAKNAGSTDVVALLEERIAALQKAVVESPNDVSVPPDTPPARKLQSQELEKIDFSVWEEDKTSSPPPPDTDSRAVASSLQKSMSTHIPVDTSEDWSDVELDLPDIPSGFRLGNILARPVMPSRAGRSESARKKSIAPVQGQTATHIPISKPLRSNRKQQSQAFDWQHQSEPTNIRLEEAIRVAKEASRERRSESTPVKKATNRQDHDKNNTR